LSNPAVSLPVETPRPPPGRRRGEAASRAAAARTLALPHRLTFRQILPFLGPAFVASVAYMDPGNFATNIQAGAKFGYLLLWVVVASNLMAMLIQTLSAKVGIATGRSLAELCRDEFPRPVGAGLWLIAEAVAIATDLAELLGAALGLNLLFGIPLTWAALIAAAGTLVILALESRGMRRLEALIGGFVAVILVCYVIELFMGAPNWGELLGHAVTPRFSGVESILLASGILGATVMPHAIYLHSALTQNRIVVSAPGLKRRLFKLQLIDVAIAMGLAGLVNGAMLIVAASTFHFAGYSDVGSIEEAYRTLEPLLGRAASVVFGIALLASGLSSSAVGTMAGQAIMQGFLRRRVPLLVRRLVTMAPALVVIQLGLDPTRSLVISQVILSFGIPFALVPLLRFTADRRLMGVLANRRLTTALGALVAGVIIALNIFLLAQVFAGAAA